MGLVQVNTANNWMASASGVNFSDSTDVNRYMNFQNALANGETPPIDTDLFTQMMNKLSSFFSGFTAGNKSSLFGMMLDGIKNVLGIGYNILGKLGITSIVNTLCGGFDSGTYSRYGNMDSIFGLGLMSLLTALLCMAIKGALAVVAGALGLAGLAVGALVGVVDLTLDTLGFNPIKNITSGISNGIFGSPNREYNNTNIGIAGIVDDIVGDNNLTNVFKNTSTAERLMSGYVGKGYEYESRLNTLLPDYSVKTLSKSKNAGNLLLNSGKSTAVNGINNVIGSVTKKDYLMLL